MTAIDAKPLTAAQGRREEVLVAELAAIAARQAATTAEVPVRDVLIRKLHEAPYRWSTRRIASLVGMTHSNVALIVAKSR